MNSYLAVIWERKYFRIDKVSATESVSKEFTRTRFLDSIFRNTGTGFFGIYGKDEYVDVFAIFTTLSNAKHSIIRDFFRLYEG